MCMGAAAIFAFLGAQGSPIFSLFAGVISTVGELDLIVLLRSCPVVLLQEVYCGVNVFSSQNNNSIFVSYL